MGRARGPAHGTGEEGGGEPPGSPGLRSRGGTGESWRPGPREPWRRAAGRAGGWARGSGESRMLGPRSRREGWGERDHGGGRRRPAPPRLWPRPGRRRRGAARRRGGRAGPGAKWEGGHAPPRRLEPEHNGRERLRAGHGDAGGAAVAWAPSFVDPWAGCRLSGFPAGVITARPVANGPELPAELCVRRAGLAAVPSASPRLPRAGSGGPEEGDRAGPTRVGKPGCRVSVARQARPPWAARPWGPRLRFGVCLNAAL